MRSMLPKLAALVFSTVFTVYSMELFLVFVNAPTTKINKQEAASGIPQRQGFDQRSKLQVVQEYRSRGIEAIPSVTPRVLMNAHAAGRIDLNRLSPDILPLGGVAKKLTVLCNETGQYVTYESDEHGYRNPAGTWEWPVLSLAAVGDSQTHGYCVADDQTYVGRIRARFPRILNLGIAGNGPLLGLAGIREYLPEFTPSIVLWFFSEVNDIGDTLSERENGILMRYLDRPFKQGLLGQQQRIDAVLMSFLRAEISSADQSPTEGSGSRLVSFLRIERLRRFVGGRVFVKSDLGDFAVFEAALREGRDTVRSWGGELILVYLPGSSNYNKGVWNRWSPADEIRERVFEIADELGISLVDIHAVFQEHENPRALFPGHYSEEGNRLVAEAVLAELTMRLPPP